MSRKEKSPEVFRLIAFMKDRQIDAEGLAAATSISERTITNYIYSDLPIGGQLLRQLHDVFDVSIDWMLSGHGAMYIGQGAEQGRKAAEAPRRALIPYQEPTDMKNMADFWWLVAKSTEQSLIESGAVPGQDYSLLDLYQLAQPFVLEQFKSGETQPFANPGY
jgi:transcriptional regulator with XRE-family HTH domain